MRISVKVLAGLFLPAMLLASVPEARAANLETLPVQAPAGAGVTARGDSYAPDQVVTLRLTSVDPDINEILGDYFANGEGRLFAQYNIPDVPVGRYMLEARDRLGSLLATAVQDVADSPDLALEPVSGAPGTRVDVRFGPVPAGSVELHYDGVRILGPLQHAGGDFLGEFLVPADFPDPLGNSVDVQAISRSGNRITATTWTVFESEMADATGFRLLSAELPEDTLRGGQPYQVTGQLALPAGVDPEEVSPTLVWITDDDVLIPVNHQPIQMDATGHFVADATAPSLASGSPLANLGATDDNGMVYKTPKQSGLFILGRRRARAPT